MVGFLFFLDCTNCTPSQWLANNKRDSRRARYCTNCPDSSRHALSHNLSNLLQSAVPHPPNDSPIGLNYCSFACLMQSCSVPALQRSELLASSRDNCVDVWRTQKVRRYKCTGLDPRAFLSQSEKVDAFVLIVWCITPSIVYYETLSMDGVREGPTLLSGLSLYTVWYIYYRVRSIL